MFEDLIPERDPDPIPVSKDSLIKAMKDNIKHKDKHIRDLLSEIISRGQTIESLKKELDYLRDL